MNTREQQRGDREAELGNWHTDRDISRIQGEIC